MFQTHISGLTRLGLLRVVPGQFMIYGQERASSGNGKDLESEQEVLDKLPEEPTNCCMSGCANCVWIKYADDLNRFYRDGGQRARQVILDQVTDPNMRAFLLTELKNLENSKTD